MWLAVCAQLQLPTLSPVHGLLGSSSAVPLVRTTPHHARGPQSFLSGFTLSQHPFSMGQPGCSF